MKIKTKVSLTSEQSIGYGHLLHCCGKYQPVHVKELEFFQYWMCVECKKPLLLRTDTGYYLIGQEVTI